MVNFLLGCKKKKLCGGIILTKEYKGNRADLSKKKKFRSYF